jgi:UDP-N-acetylmuramoyl-tripeptide--D-alanyl-D-alanine ligase
MDVHPGRYTVVNDAYNANPQSMRSAIDSVAAMSARRRIGVFGPMRELGPICEDAHREIGAHAVASGFDRVLVVGPDHGYVLGAGDRTLNATGLSEAADTLRAVVEPGDVVLVKASRASGLERLAMDLAEDAAP